VCFGYEGVLVVEGVEVGFDGVVFVGGGVDCVW